MIVTAAALAAAIYLVLTLGALLTALSPLLYALSTHGKTRISNHGCKNNHHHRVAGVAGGVVRRLRRLLLDGLTVHKRRFVDFYAVGIVTTLIFVGATIRNHSRSHVDVDLPEIRRWLPVFLSLLQVIRRFGECVWVQKSGDASRMHLGVYLVGIVHYLCLPFVLAPPPPRSASACSDIDDGSVPPSFGSDGACISSATHAAERTSLGDIVNVAAIVGCIFFQYQQNRHHVILANLRTAESRTAYSIPKGRWFEYVSCPHYFSETMIYFAFAMLSNEASSAVGESYAREWIDRYNLDVCTSQLQTVISRGNCIAIVDGLYQSKHWILFAWVATNQSLSANRSHEWYLANFGADYPRERKRLIPLMW